MEWISCAGKPFPGRFLKLDSTIASCWAFGGRVMLPTFEGSDKSI